MFTSPMERINKYLVLLFVVALVLAIWSFSVVQAATITITDATGAVAIDTFCSLPEAIINANDGAQTHADCVSGTIGADIIELNSLTVTLTTGAYDPNGHGATGLPAITDALTIQNGTIQRSGASEFRLLYLDSSLLTLDSVALRSGGGDTYTGNGGAIYANGTLTVNNSTFYGNQSINYGGAVYLAGGALSADATYFQYNTAGNKDNATGLGSGGGIYADASFVVINSYFDGNAALISSGVGHGGGLYANGVAGVVANSVFTGNYAGLWMVGGASPAGTGLGGGLYNNAGLLTLTNLTIADNYANQGGGGIYTTAAATSNIYNTIVYNNTTEIANQDIFNGGLTALFSTLYGVQSGGFSDGGGNLSSDPVFVLPGYGGNYRLQGSSPAINAGNNGVDPDGGGALPAMSNAFWSDFDGNPRIINSVIDLGAYEYQGTTQVFGTIQDDLGYVQEHIDVFIYVAGTTNLVDRTCSDATGNYSIFIGYVGSIDVKAGGIIPADSLCTYATSVYNQTSQNTTVAAGGNYQVNLTLNPASVPVPAPIISAPTGVRATQTPTFVWTRRDGASAYQILVEEGAFSANFSVDADTACGANSTCTYTPMAGQELPYSLGNYRAFVRAANSLGMTAWGNATYFQLSPIIHNPSGITFWSSPAEASITSLTPTLQWTNVPTASHYRIFVKEYNGTSWLETASGADSNCSSGTCSYTLASLEGYMGVRVLPLNAVGASGWSSARYFFSTAASGIPADPIITSPAAPVVTDVTTIEWTHEPGVYRYALYAIPPGANSAVFENNPVSTYCPGLPGDPTCSTTINTTVDGLHNAQLIALNYYGYSNWAANWVTRLPTVDILSAPAWINLNAVTDASSIPLTWMAVNGASNYTVVVYDPQGISHADVYDRSICTGISCTVTFNATTAGQYTAYVRASNILATGPFAMNTLTVRVPTSIDGQPIIVADTDGDGINDTLDNCTLVANDGQLDRDGDGIGAACDWNDTPNTMPSVGSDDDTNPNDGGRGLPGAPSNPDDRSQIGAPSNP